MQQKIKAILAKLKAQVMPRLAPSVNQVVDYWKHMSYRDKRILGIGGICAVLMLIFLLITSALDLEGDLQRNILINNEHLSYTQSMHATLNELSQINANEFSTPSADKIKGDVTQLFDIKNPDITLIDHVLTISVPNVKFELVMLFLDQLRKSYGIFPVELKITRASTSGYVSFRAVFNVED